MVGSLAHDHLADHAVGDRLFRFPPLIGGRGLGANLENALGFLDGVDELPDFLVGMAHRLFDVHVFAVIHGFERDAIGLIAANPDVTFDIYLPPYSILQWVAMRDAAPSGTLQSVYDFSAYFCRRLAAFPNVRLHDFRGVSEVTHDLNDYADVIHHSPAVDLKVLSWLAEGKYLVDRAAPTASLDRLKAQVEAYRIENVER